MPTPKQNETEQEFVERCIPIVIDEGTAKDGEQAAAVCHSMYRQEKMKLETVNIGDVEIFEAGKFNGVEVNENDLDEMINNFRNGVTEPYITIDHDDNATAQFKDALKALSLGFVSSLRKTGKKLVADFKQVPKTLAELIEAGALKKKSIEFYKKYLHADGSKYNNVLQGVTFHGANGSPAVTTLSDFLTLYKNELKEKPTDNREENEIIQLTNKEMHMENVTISKEEYSELIQYKNESPRQKSDLEKATNEVTQLKNEKDVLTKRVSDLEKVETEFAEFKKTAQENAAKAIKAEAEAFIDASIKAMKIAPAYKDMYVKNYIASRGDENELKMFKDEIENRPEIISGSAVSTGEGAEQKVSDVDDLEKAIEYKMKKENITFAQAREKILSGMEV